MSKTEGDCSTTVCTASNSFACLGITYVPAPVEGDVEDRCTLCIEQECNCWIPVYAPETGIETFQACTPNPGGTTMCKAGGIKLGKPGQPCESVEQSST